MAVNVDIVYKTVLSILNKEQRGYITPSEFNKIATQVQLEIFNEYFNELSQQLRIPDNDSEYADHVKEIQEKILNLEKEGKGNDLIGKLLKIDGGTVRKYLIEYYGIDKYKERHSIDKFLTPNYSGFINDRGDRFHSSLEVLVADYLFEIGVKYFSNIRLPYNGKNYSPDFYLPKTRTFIEVFGMSNVGVYKSRMNEKIEFYNSNNIKCLFLFEDSFMLNKKYIDSYKIKLDNFLVETEGRIFNQHIKKIHINNKK